MHLHLPNHALQPVIDLLTGMPLTGTHSRARTKLLTLVKDAHLRYAEDEYQLVCDYATTDEHGEPIIDTTGTFSIDDPTKAREFHTQRAALLASIVEISGPTYDSHTDDLRTLLVAYDQSLIGPAVDAYDLLCTALEEQK